MWSRLLYVTLFTGIFSVFGEDAPPESPTEVKPLSKGKPDMEESNSLSSHAGPKHATSTDDDANSLAEALQVLQRRKREISRAHRPYSAYRPLGTHRYRYPLYRKRAAYYTPDYYDEDAYASASEDNSYFDDFEKPSLFRERERGPVPELISNAHFSSKPIYHKRKNPNAQSQYAPPKNTLFNLETTPYDLNVMGKLYELGKRAENSPTVDKHMYMANDVLSNFGPTSERMGTTHYFPDEAKDKAYTNLLKSVSDEEPTLRNSMIRQKRASTPNGFTIYHDADNGTSTNKSGANHPVRYNHNGLKKTTERQKRAYEDSSIFLTPDEDENDFLTREYFKTIARSVGNKRKRMAYAKFEAQKRSNGIDTFLENPQMLHYVQEQIREAEEEVAKDAENEIRKNSKNDLYPKDDLTAQVLLSNSIARLDALERMRESLYQLENLQEQEAIRKRGQDLMGSYSEDDKEKRRKALRGRLIREGQMEEEEERQKRMREDMRRKRKDQEEDRRKRKEQALRNLIKDCPVLERIVINCIAVTEMVADEDMVFLEPCLRHEVCYMCGSGLDVSRHECDALLSSALEAGCNDVQGIQGRNEGALDCLSAAGETYNILGDSSRYDDKGTCTFDPCVRQLIDSR